jgi:hypothetical protein
MSYVRTTLRQLVPGPASLVLGLLGLALLGVWGLLTLAMLVDPLEGQTMVGAGATVGALMFAPLAALLFAVAGVVDRRPVARAAWLWVAAGTVMASGLLLGLAMGLEPWLEGLGMPDGDSLGVGLFGVTCCGFVPACLFAIPALLATVRGVRELRLGTSSEALDALVELLHRRGQASFEEIARVADIPEERIEPVLFLLRRQGRLLCRVSPEAAWVCTQRHEQEGLRALPGMVLARGRVDLAELGRELQAPAPVLRAWIYEAVGAGRLQGYMDWRRGVVWSREATKLQAAGACPGCGGRLELVGRGVVQCPYCEAEIFL